MLLQFSVENFKSFKNRAVLSLEASVDNELPNNITILEKDRFLNSIAVFGANAAGKSNLFHALTAAILTIRQSNTIQVGEPLSFIVPYRFAQNYAEIPTSFEFVFIADGKKYVYGFSATQKAVIKEYLYVYNTSKPSTIFERASSRDFHYTSAARRREFKPVEERNTDNKLFLATATMWNCESTKIPFLWLQQNINTYPTPNERLLGQIAPRFEADEDNSLKRFTNNILHEADISIDNYEFKSEEVPVEQLPPPLRNIFSTLPLASNKAFHIETIHTIDDGKEKHQYRLGLEDESSGTINLFCFSPILKRALDIGETVCIDEFDASMHPMLVVYLFGLFNNPSINKKHAQLIVSSHSMVLMSLKNLRRDQIYFVEKDRKTGVSELYSLDEFSPRKQENVRKAYLLGRYGSIPDISEDPILWQ